MTITLTPDIEARLRDEAARRGAATDTLAVELIAAGLEAAGREWESDVAAIQEAFDAIDQGRERPFDDLLTEHRTQYGGSKAMA